MFWQVLLFLQELEIFLLFGYLLERYNYFAVHESNELCNVSEKQQ
jgi:hypothetical protein